jgi:hypothetical protein
MIEFSSILKVTSNYGTPLEAGGMSDKENSPSLWLSFVNGLSPSNTGKLT